MPEPTPAGAPEVPATTQQPTTTATPQAAPVAPATSTVTKDDLDRLAAVMQQRAQAGQPQQQQPQDSQGKEPAPDGEEPFDKDRALAKIHKANTEAEALRKRLKELEPLAELGKQVDDARKTDMQRHEEARLRAEQERDGLRVRVAQMEAAARYGIPADLVDLLGTGTAEEIATRAEMLAKRLAPPPADAPAATPAPAGNGRPVESLRPGGAPGDSAAARDDPNAWLRQMARR